MSEWIKCSEQMPAARLHDSEVSDEVLAYVIGRGGYVRMITVFYSFTDDDWLMDDGEPMESGERVTHWQPLPAPPAEGE